MYSKRSTGLSLGRSIIRLERKLDRLGLSDEETERLQEKLEALYAERHDSYDGRNDELFLELGRGGFGE